MGNHFTPVENRVVSDSVLRESLLEDGYAVLPALPDWVLSELNTLYEDHHRIGEKGMFYTLYSKDFDYRKKIHEGIIASLKPWFESHFTRYKSSFNLFIVKTSEVQEEFFIHTDPTCLDESRFSPLHVWIPLCDVDEKSGALCLVPRSHYLAYPFRNIAIDPPFENIRNTLRPYLKPIPMKRGEVLLFDPRLMHNSLPNLSGKDRVAVLCGIFPQEAEIRSVFRDPEIPGAPVEIYRQDEDFFLSFPDFFETCRMRPNMGTRLEEVQASMPEFSREEFIRACEKNKIPKENFFSESDDVAYCRMFGEPASTR